MIRKQVLFLTAFFSAIAFYGQTPGYQGKKTVVGYGFYINPAITAALIDYGTNVINTQHEFFLERTVKKGVALGFSVKIYKSTYNNTNDELDLGLRSSDYLSEDRSPRGDYAIRGRNCAFYAKLYRRSYVAPWGKYFLLGFTYNAFTANYSPDKMYVPVKRYTGFFSGSYEESEFNNFGPTEQTFNYIDIMIGNGNSRIFANKIVLDYGYNLNVIATTLVLVDAFDDRSTTAADYIQRTSLARVRGINRFNFFVKLGYLF